MKSITKRILIMCFCTMFFVSSIFTSYQVTVYASEKNVTFEDLLEDALYVALSALGIYGYVQSGGVLNLSVLMPFIYSIAGEGVDLHGYITQDEEAGTTTISADFVNLVLQAYQQYREENGEKFDGVMVPGSSGYYHYESLSGTAYLNANIYQSAVYTDINTYYPCAVLVNSNKRNGSGYIINAPLIFYDKNDDLFYTATHLNYGMPDDCKSNLDDFGQILEASLFLNKPNCAYNNSGNTGTEQSYPTGRIYESASWYESIAYCEVSSSSIPVYQSLSALKEGLRTGDFSGAYNYGKVPECETPAYTGTYEGGDITVPTEKLEGIQDKLDEIDQTDKDIYEKLKELLEWLLGNGGIGGGTDVTATNSWLEKIYLKVCQIFDKISETATGAVDTVNTKLQETLDEILNTLKSIRRWTIADTVFDGVDALADVASLLKDFLTAPAAAIGTAASSLGETANMLTDKFPFSIPWDMAALVTLLSAEPQAPVFKLPIAIESVGIEEYIEIDMSQFEYLSTIMRGMLSILYAYGILSMTTKVMDIGGKK